MEEATVPVPPGHSVALIRPLPSHRFGRTGSGIFVLDLGTGFGFAPAVGEAERLISSGHQATVLWILQEALLVQLIDTEPLVERIQRFVKRSEWQVRHIAVLVQEAAGRQDLVQRLRNIGMGVHGSAKDGTCFIEVYRPDGTIVIGMGGSEL